MSILRDEAGFNDALERYPKPTNVALGLNPFEVEPDKDSRYSLFIPLLSGTEFSGQRRTSFMSTVLEKAGIGLLRTPDREEFVGQVTGEAVTRTERGLDRLAAFTSLGMVPVARAVAARRR